jgi:hypothetical protein
VLLAMRTNAQRTTHSDADATFAFHVHLRGFRPMRPLCCTAGGSVHSGSAARFAETATVRWYAVADRSVDRPPHPSHGQLALSGRRFVALGLAVLALGTTEELRRSALQ